MTRRGGADGEDRDLQGPESPKAQAGRGFGGDEERTLFTLTHLSLFLSK